MPDSEELNEILKEIKNINAPKEEKPKKPEAPPTYFVFSKTTRITSPKPRVAIAR